MSYAEAAYFDGDACAHCAARDDVERLARFAKAARLAMRGNRRAR